MDADDTCECGHIRSDHCLDDECCVFARDERGGVCFVRTCQCAQFKKVVSEERLEKP